MEHNKKPFNIPNILTSLKTKYQKGYLTLKEVADELYEANWTSYLDLEYAKKIVTDKNRETGTKK